jgi:hypothetical protein
MPFPRHHRRKNNIDELWVSTLSKEAEKYSQSAISYIYQEE